MSQYLSSLIEPIARQARRFSQPTHQHLSEGLRPSLIANEPHPNDFHQAASVATSLTAEEGPLTPRLPTYHHEFTDAVTTDVRVAFPASVEGADFQTSSSVNSDSAFASPLEIDNLDAEVSARWPSVEIGVNRSDPRPVNNDRLRSSASSLSHSAQSALNANVSPANVSAPTSEFAVRDRAGSQNSRTVEGPLPADDGMGHMRHRIIAIQRTDSSDEVKARLVHTLMTEKHNSSQQNLHLGHGLRGRSPASFQSSDRPITPSSPASVTSLGRPVSSHSTSPSSALDAAKLFLLSAEDLKPTFFEKPGPIGKDADSERRLSESDEESRALGCAHYKRNIKLQCSACHRWYTCRFCHDAVEDHMLNRRETKNMLCMLCGCAQPASEECAKCKERGAWYYCDVCKLWDDDLQKNIYHCEECGICRLGQGLGKDFFHCKTCCVCMSIAIRDSHRCIERSTDCDCPICGEYMFTSPQTVVFMRCGHSIHSRCYYEHMRTSYRCPICSRSVVNTEFYFIRLSRAIESQPMPPEFQDTKAWVYCNDCNARSSVKYHWLGLKCAVCDSYNTAQLQILRSPDVDADRSDIPDLSNQAGDLLQPIASLSRVTSRGRSRLPHSRLPRSGVSAPPVVNAHDPPDFRRDAHSVGPMSGSAFPFSRSPSLSDLQDFMDTDNEGYSEIDFWGGESPRDGQAFPPARRPDCGMSINYDDDDDDDDESGSNGDGDGDGGERMSGTHEWEDEELEGDGMELLGHR